ncbi:GDSL esterase/lipase At2g40250-like [Telopea speciosissima]|uniref:GDSL esterase/lipase At2g40250-like n=1 Tax=Telopea speciosissima TaxID=54955 RepID=UPI001CC592E5|nr:GDSL esterase/lipase At2g40250-like [Telopea speciosissima]
MEKGRVISIALFFFTLVTVSYFSDLLVVVVVASSQINPKNYNITALFVFGDSTLDPGNNDRLTTSLRGDHPPYGRDFKGGIATGSFTNEKFVTDMIVSSLGIKDSVPAYLDPNITNHNLLTGVSFASAGTGLDDMTANLRNVIHMSTQLVDFKKCVARIQATVGNATAANIIQNAIF